MIVYLKLKNGAHLDVTTKEDYETFYSNFAQKGYCPISDKIFLMDASVDLVSDKPFV